MEPGMSRMQAESFPAVVLPRNHQQEERSFAELMSCAQRFSPRIEIIASPQEETCGATLVLDVSGSERLLGSALQIATTLRQSLYAAGYEASVATAHNAYAAILAARGIPGVTAIAPGREAETLAPLPLTVLETAQAEAFATWGIHTLGQLAALPAQSLVARVGQSGFRLQAEARGEYGHLLVPTEEPADAALCESLELEHQVELLEPLLFLLSQMLEQVLQRAAQRALAIASVETCLIFKRKALESTDAAPMELRRTVRPALPERDRLTLLKLIQLDLELHPPQAPVVALRIEVHTARPQSAQQGLFAAQAPETGRLEILLARLRKLVGEGRVGTPELLDTHAPEAFRVTNFELGHNAIHGAARGAPHLPRLADVELRHSLPFSALRMVRPPRAIAVELHGDTPSAMYYEGQRLTLHSASGPWRTSGVWWTHPAWCREEWDVVLKEETLEQLQDWHIRRTREPAFANYVKYGASSGRAYSENALKEEALNKNMQRCLRLAHDPAASCWYVIGTYD